MMKAVSTMCKRPVVLLLVMMLASWVALSPATSRELSVSELARMPDSWVLQQVGGKRVVVDGRVLDVRIQYLLEQFRAAEAKQQQHPQTDPGATAQGRAAIRKGAGEDWIRRTNVPPAMEGVHDYEVQGRSGSIHVRVYHPHATGQLPIIVYFHGGGWFFGSVAASDRSNELLAAEAAMIVVAVDYRLAPEAPYPAAWNDAEDAYGWVTKMAAQLGGSATDICVGGDSAGGNLAIAVTRRRLAAGESAPVCQLLYYPAVDNRSVDEMRRTYRSSTLFGDGFGLDRAFMEYVLPRVFQQRDRKDPEISPLFAPSVANMPPTFFGVAGFDPLRDSQRAYAVRLIDAGDTVGFWEFPTIAHGFLQMTAVSNAAQFAASASARAFGRFAREASAGRAPWRAQRDVVSAPKGLPETPPHYP